MKKIILLMMLLGIFNSINAQYIARYRDGMYDGKYIHGVNNSGTSALSGDPSYRELPPNISEGVYCWWNYASSVGEPSDSFGAAIGFGKGTSGTAEIWAGWTNGKLFTRFLRDCCQGWSEWNQIWTANTDGANSGLDADLVDGLQPVLIQSSGNVGIGTNSPDVKLRIDDTYSLIRFDAVDGQFRIRSTRTSSNYKTSDLLLSSQRNLILFPDGGNGTFCGNGNVLIGKTSQQNTNYKLDVAGSIRANEIKVNLDGADFVFEPDYKLKPLNEVESYIKENKRLPEIASADEMSKDGADLGELNTKLLQKIEELTLYMIEMNKEVKTLKNENSKLIGKVKELEAVK